MEFVEHWLIIHTELHLLTRKVDNVLHCNEHLLGSSVCWGQALDRRSARCPREVGEETYTAFLYRFLHKFFDGHSLLSHFHHILHPQITGTLFLDFAHLCKLALYVIEVFLDFIHGENAN